MKHVVCAVRDAKAEAFGQPFFSQQRGLAIRTFADECERKESQLNKHADDFSLFVLGEYDDVAGELIPFTPQVIAYASDYAKILT